MVGIFLLDKTCNINEAIKINPTLSSARTEPAAIGGEPWSTFGNLPSIVGGGGGWKTFKTHGETVVKLDNSISAGLQSPRVSGNKINLESFFSEER